MLQYLQTLISTMPKSEKGQDLAEYGLLVALIAIIVMAAVLLFGNALNGFFTALSTEVASWAAAIP